MAVATYTLAQYVDDLRRITGSRYSWSRGCRVEAPRLTIT
jgi:hypothetical protein